MNNTFTYAIDERNLRIQLRSIESLPSSEAWEKFESFADANPFKTAKRPFSGIQIGLNRNVVLPAVFGIVICLFSLLLLNFVSIKNPQVQNTHKAELSPVIPEPTFVKTEHPFTSSAPQQVKTDEVNTLATKPAPAEITQETTQPAANISSPAQVIDPSVTAGTTMEQPVTEVKKRRKKATPIEEQIRPTTFTEESAGEPEEIPN